MKKTIATLITIGAVFVASATATLAQDDTTSPTKSPLAQASICTISTSESRTVQVRVGPGENRTSVTFLPVDVAVAVTGQTEDDNGNLWYQVDKETAAAGRAINEAWVLADSVETSGNCEELSEAVAPPIIPIVTQPPPTVDDETGEVVATNVLPNAGSWTVNWGATTIAVCEDIGTVSIPTSDLFGTAGMQLTVPLTTIPRDDTVNFMFFGTPMFANGVGAYQGVVAFIDHMDYYWFGTLYIDSIISANQMVGRFVVMEDACTGTFTFTATHN